MSGTGSHRGICSDAHRDCTLGTSRRRRGRGRRSSRGRDGGGHRLTSSRGPGALLGAPGRDRTGRVRRNVARSRTAGRADLSGEAGKVGIGTIQSRRPVLTERRGLVDGRRVVTDKRHCEAARRSARELAMPGPSEGVFACGTGRIRRTHRKSTASSRDLARGPARSS